MTTRRREALSDGVLAVAITLRRTLPRPLVYGASIGLAYLSALGCLVLYAGMAVYFIIPGREAREAPAPAGP